MGAASVNPGFQAFLKTWYQTPQGRLLYRQERQLIESAVANLFGYYFVQLGCPADTEWLNASRIVDKIVLDESSDSCRPASGIKRVAAEMDYLPLARESVDVVLMPHTLETVQDPYYLLRQADSALVPEGHLVLTGFNPFACATLKNRMGRDKKSFRSANLVRSRRVIEWLEVLGYDIEAVRFSTISCYTGTSQKSARAGWRLLERIESTLGRLGVQFGNVYCIVARKRVDAPRMVGLSWKGARWWNFGKAGQVVSNRSPSRNFRRERSPMRKRIKRRRNLAND